MRKLLTLVLVLLFAVAAPLAWGQDDPGFEEGEMQTGDESEVVADESGDEQVESDQGADGENMAEPEADEAVVDEPFESEAAEESSADEESFAADEDTSADMTDAGDTGDDMSESEGAEAFADDAIEPDEASEGESAGDEFAEATDQSDEEEESEDSADSDDVLATDDAEPEIGDGEVQTADNGEVEGASGNNANVNQPSPAPASNPEPAPPASPPPPPAPAANPGSAQSSEGNPWPTAKFSFMVDFGSGDIPFQEVSGLDVETQVIEYRRPDSPVDSNQRMPGLAKFGNVTLKKGVFVKDNELLAWYQRIKLNQIERRTITIKLMDESGAPTMSWTLKNAFPRKMTVTDMKSDSNEAAVEAIEIAHEGLNIVNQ